MSLIRRQIGIFRERRSDRSSTGEHPWDHLAEDESGFTMVVTIMGTFLLSLIMAVSVSAVQGDLNLTRFDHDHKRAYEAAQSGIADYVFHLNQDNAYFTYCDNVPPPTAVNLEGSTANRRAVDNQPARAEYAIELLPSSGNANCVEGDPASMVETTGEAAGTFRIRSTGYAGKSDVSIVAQFKRTSFLDFIYFTELETSDPVTYGNATEIAGAYTQCTKTIDEGRYSAPIPGTSRYCTVINFISGEQILGPLHTNDSIVVCGTPEFGRDPADRIEVSGNSPGWYGNGYCSNNNPTFTGSFLTEAPLLTPPPTNTAIKREADAGYIFSGATRITLNPGSIDIIKSNGSTETKPYPPNGVIYVESSSCTGSYSPFNATASYVFTSGCGNAYVKGTYDGRLTIGAENDVIIQDDLLRQGTGMLGLVANNFVRVYHPVTVQTTRSNCSGGVNLPGSQSNLVVEAAIMAINHSFQVDHYNCGGDLGTLRVEGAIAQKFRGAVGTFGGSGSTGYDKDYEYDDRLRYVQPPHFLDPVQAAWSVARQTLDD